MNETFGIQEALKELGLKEINNGAILLFFTMMFSSSFHKVIRRHRDLSEERVINSKRFWKY